MHFYRWVGFLVLLALLPFYLNAKTIQDTLLGKALQLNLYNDYQWKKLLHMNGETPKIYDPSFILSYANFSTRNELKATLDAFIESSSLGDKHAICRFPARYYWIKNKLQVGDGIFPKPKCAQLQQYTQQAKLKDLKLVFVAGDATSPSGMMGHIFFKIIGQKNQRLNKEYAVSFFTSIDSINIPLVLFQGLITGMKGFFTLRPYAEQEGIYLKEDNRNMWEYDLDIPYSSKYLIYLHFWELRSVKIKYFYAKFNCSTIVQDMLSLISKNLYRKNNLWLTPQKVIKNAKQAKLLGNAKFKASNKQAIKMLVNRLSPAKETNFLDPSRYFKKDDIKSLKFANNKKISALEKELLKVYSQYNYINDDIPLESFLEANKKVGQSSENENIESDTRNTFHTLGDIQLSISHIHREGQNNLELVFLPYSSTLYEDNRGYFGESDLRLMELGLILDDNSLKVSMFNFYSIKSLLPWNSFTKDMSSSFEINYKTHYGKNLDEHKAYNVSIGKGYTKELSKDFYIYSLVNIGLAYSQNSWYTYLAPETGLIFYESNFAKTLLKYSYIYNQVSSHDYYHSIEATQSFFINNSFNLTMGVNYKKSSKEDEISSTISLHYYF